MRGLPDQARLRAVAYRMLGSVADAEDVVAEARYRLLKANAAPDNESAYLLRVVTNLALDRLRDRRRVQDAYAGPWLPEPLPTEFASDADAADLMELAEELSVGLLLMLERLSPAERVVFVLRQGFDYSFAEIAVLVDSTADACRQRYRRAKAHLAGEPRYTTPAPEQQALLDGLLMAVAQRDTDALVAMFSQDSVVITDGGGVVSAAIRPITGRQRIAQVILHLTAKETAKGLQMVPVQLNGGAAILVHDNGAPHSCFQVEGTHGVVERLYIMRNPEKMRHLAALVPAAN